MFSDDPNDNVPNCADNNTPLLIDFFSYYQYIWQLNYYNNHLVNVEELCCILIKLKQIKLGFPRKNINLSTYL